MSPKNRGREKMKECKIIQFSGCCCGNSETDMKTRTKTNKKKKNQINSRTTLGTACHARNAQAHERPRDSTRVSRTRDRRRTPLGPVQTCRADQTRHPALCLQRHICARAATQHNRGLAFLVAQPFACVSVCPSTISKGNHTHGGLIFVDDP